MSSSLLVVAAAAVFAVSAKAGWGGGSGPAPVVCQQYEESAGHCRDSHDPLSHLWPMPLRASSGPPLVAGQQQPVVLLNASFHIVTAGGGPALRAAAARYHDIIFAPVRQQASLTAAAQAEARYQDSAPAATTLRVTVRDTESPTLPVTDQDESYVLDLDTDGSGSLAANTTIGALRGLESFSQLVEYSTEGEVQLWQLPVKITDRPHWRYRGIKVDTSRHFISIHHLQNIIRAMEAAKMNVLQWHIIDGQSFPLESKIFPSLSEKGRYCKDCSYSQAEIKALVAYARARGVRIIPELDIPGHSGFQYGMPEIVACPFDQSGQGSNRALDPTLNQTYTFLTEFLTEQAQVFGDPAINVYGDEVRFECWNQSATIRSWMRAHGMADGDFQGLTQMFWQRFAREVAPTVYRRTGVAMMIGEAVRTRARKIIMSLLCCCGGSAASIALPLTRCCCAQDVW
jgi:N-acetyl-beta-hexosaminidase